MPPIKIGKARRSLGGLAFKKTKTLTGKIAYSGFKLTISSAADLSETELEDVIIHEMIHYYILYNQIHDSSPHGDIFRSIMNKINKADNRHVRVAVKSSEVSMPQHERKAMPVIICTGINRNGKTLLATVPKTRLFEYWDIMPYTFGLNEPKWYVSANPYFRSFPKSLKPKMYIVNNDELKIQLADAKPLKKQGNTITTR